MMQWSVRVFVPGSSPETVSPTLVRERKRLSACLVFSTEGRIHVCPRSVFAGDAYVID